MRLLSIEQTMKVPQVYYKYVPVLAFAAVSMQAFGASPVPAGVGNFHQVSEHVYRGAQPTDEGFKNLAKLGVKTVIDLRLPDEHSISAEENAVKSAGMRYVNI